MSEAIDRFDRLLEPHIAVVVAYDGDQPVAAAQAVLSHGIAGVYWVGTLEAARGKGLGEAVCRWVTNWAFDQGAAAQTCRPRRMGEPIYARMGYETIYRYTSWFRSGGALSDQLLKPGGTQKSSVGGAVRHPDVHVVDEDGRRVRPRSCGRTRRRVALVAKRAPVVVDAGADPVAAEARHPERPLAAGHVVADAVDPDPGRRRSGGRSRCWRSGRHAARFVTRPAMTRPSGVRATLTTTGPGPATVDRHVAEARSGWSLYHSGR